MFKFTNQYKKQEIKIQKLIGIIDNYNNELNILRLQNEELNKNIDALKTENKNKIIEISNLNINKQQLEKSNELQQYEIDTLNKKINELKDEKENLQKLLDNFQQDKKYKLELEKKKSVELKLQQYKFINILKQLLNNKDEEIQLRVENKNKLKIEQYKFISILKEVLDNKYNKNRSEKYEELTEILSYEYLSIERAIRKINNELYYNENAMKFIKDIITKEDAIKRFIELVIDIYSLGEGIGYEQLYKNIFETNFIEKICKKYLDQSNYENIMTNYKYSKQRIKNNIGVENLTYNIYGNFEDGEIGFFDIFIYLKENNSIEELLLGLISSNHYFNKINTIDDIEKNYNLNIMGKSLKFTFYKSYLFNEENRKNLYFITQFLYAYIVACYIIFLKQLKILVKNKEIMSILKNIEREKNEINYILFKFYPIYENFYSNIFYKKFTLCEIKILILAFKDIELSKEFLRYSYYNEIIEDFKEDRDLENLINNIDSNIFLKSYNEKYLKISKNNQYYYSELIDYIFIKVKEHLSKEEFFNILFDKQSYIKKLQKNEELKKVLAEKNKYLYNKNIESKNKSEKLTLNKVKTGNEFEHFLRQLFSSLGYNAVITKASNDQGADLVIEKNNQKTVVQAKFYSSKVSNKAIQEVIASKLYYKADNCMVVTNNDFTHSAYELARVNMVTLINGIELKNMIETANILRD